MADIDEVTFDTDEVVAAEDAEDSIFEAKSSIVSFVDERFNRAEDARKSDEDRWLRAYRNYRGLYGPDVKFTDTEKSRVFVKVTKTKTLAAYGQIVDVLFGNNKFPMSVDPSDRKSTRLNSSHGYISYAVFCLKKKNTTMYLTMHSCEVT